MCGHYRNSPRAPSAKVALRRQFLAQRGQGLRYVAVAHYRLAQIRYRIPAFRGQVEQAEKIEADTYGDSEFLLHVRDDGSGIDPEVANQGIRAGHWGLPGMRERAKSFGGKLEVWSEHRAGTEIALRVPATIAYGKSDARPRFWFWRKKL